MDTPERIKKTDLKIILSEDGSVMHSLKSSEKDFKGFGESYFSTVNNGAIKAWKRHKKMTLNLTVPVGIVRFTK
jgi:dTDP-4-dehydrorhamnose 3,5-epimerase